MTELAIQPADPRDASTVRAFDHVIVRIAGAPFDDLELLRAAEALSAVERLRGEAAAIDREARAVGEALFARVGGEPDARFRRALIDAKRDLFNGRRPGPEAVRRIGEADAALGTAVAAIVERRDALERLDRQAESAFGEELTSLRQTLVALASQPLVQRGLVLSSRNLRNSFESFYRRRVGGPLNSKDLDAEIGIMKYLARVHAKTSPFSTFTNIACGHLSGAPDAFGAGGSSRLVAGDPQVVVHTGINHLVIRFAREMLLRDPATRAAAPLCLNPTLRREDGHYRFLTNSNNIEAFQRLAVHPVIDLVIEAVSGGGTTLRGAVERLAAEPRLDMTADEIAPLLDELIALGLLECDIPVSALDPGWIVAFRRFAEAPGASPRAAAMLAALEGLQEAASAFATAGAVEREALLDASQRSFSFAGEEDAAPVQSSAAGVFRRADFTLTRLPANLFYEDALLDCEPAVSRQAFSELAVLVDSFASRLGRFDVFDRDRARYHDFFNERYGAGATVDLMRFHEDFSRQRLAAASGERDGSRPSAAADQRWVEELGRRSAQRVSRGVVHVTDEDFAAADEVAPPAAGYPSRGSISGWLQPYIDDGGQLAAVVNGSLPGFGKAASRMLHLFEPMTAALRDWNARLAPEAILIQNLDASCWNSNIHPPLMPYEIRIPNGESSLPPQQQVAVSDLAIRLSGDGELALIHKASGRRAYVFDLGLQILEQRSQLYQLLAKFTLTTFSPWVAVSRALGERNAQAVADGVSAQPRVVFERRLVLRRASWIVRTAAIPRRGRDSAWSYFRRLNDWREAMMLPERVFVTIHARGFEGLVNGKPASRDDQKPQYVDFANPFLVSVFDHLLGRAREQVQIFEMLPAPAQLPTVGGRRHVAELVLHWYYGGAYA
jgi:hypothetical protein